MPKPADSEIGNTRVTRRQMLGISIAAAATAAAAVAGGTKLAETISGQPPCPLHSTTLDPLRAGATAGICSAIVLFALHRFGNANQEPLTRREALQTGGTGAMLIGVINYLIARYATQPHCPPGGRGPSSLNPPEPDAPQR